MPGRDRTGPTGMGPMTGRAAGYCGGYAGGGFAVPPGGRGFMGRGRGRGGRRGWRNQFYATGLAGWQRSAVGEAGLAGPAPATGEQDELEMLKQQAEAISEQMQQIQDRIEQIEHPEQD